MDMKFEERMTIRKGKKLIKIWKLLLASHKS